MWESQVLLTDGQVVFLRVLRFSPTFDERSARYKWNILERAVKPKSKKKKKKKKWNRLRIEPAAIYVGVKQLTGKVTSFQLFYLVTGHMGVCVLLLLLWSSLQFDPSSAALCELAKLFKLVQSLIWGSGVRGEGRRGGDWGGGGGGGSRSLFSCCPSVRYVLVLPWISNKHCLLTFLVCSVVWQAKCTLIRKKKVYQREREKKNKKKQKKNGLWIS